MKRRVLLGAMGAGLVAAGGASFLGRDVVTPAMAQDTMTEIEDMVIGSADAPIEMIEYASVTCPACASFHANTFPQLKENYIDTGKVRFVFREYYRNRFDLWATMVARCAGPVRYFGVTDILFDTQREWVANDPATTAENLRRIGRSVGMGEDELEACLSDGEFAQALVDRQEGFVAQHDIPGTPTFVINGEEQSGMGYDALAAMLDDLLAEIEG